MSTDADIRDDCRDGERAQAFRDWLADLGRDHLLEIIELQKGEPTREMLDCRSAEGLAEWVVEYCRIDSLRAEFDALPAPEYPDTAKGIPKRNA
jgi:hypothetical protein